VDDSTLFDKEKHSGLLKNIDKYSADAGITPDFIKTSLRNEYIDEQIQEWFTLFVKEIDIAFDALPNRPRYGLCLLGNEGKALWVMQMLIGAFLRQLVDARLIPLRRTQIDGDELLEVSSILIPDFASASYIASKKLSGNVQDIYTFLLERYIHQKITVIFCAGRDLTALEKLYGQGVKEFIQHKYLKVVI